MLSAPPPPPPPPPPPEGHEGVFDPRERQPSLINRAVASTHAAATSVAAKALNKARDVTPEDRERWKARSVAGLSLAASVGQVVGGKKTKVASMLTSVALGGSCGGAAASASATPAPGELLLVEAVATEDTGGAMRVQVNRVEYTVVVPPGVVRGQKFQFEVEQPAAPPVPRAVPVAAPAATAGAAGSRGGCAGAGVGGAATAAAVAAVAAGGVAASVADARAAAGTARAAGQVARDLGVTPQQAVDGAKQASAVAKDLGITPQQAVAGAKQGARLANDLGITPQNALRMGIGAVSAMNALSGAASKPQR